ncbi:MAG: outer rane lipoprotein carrier protein LolA [Verrucomicrobiaceae bacterium]|nr:outer rane lipoprotein carrier protein LolA [Verrucomicrobiaceae bacterium]
MRLFFLAFLALFSPLLFADDVALQKLSVQLDALKSMQAQFVQTVSDEKGKVLQTSQGNLAVKRGNHLRWETTSPFAYLIVTDGSVLWRYDHDLEQATRQKFKGELADAPALILSGDISRIRTNYEVMREQGSAGEYFHLTPKQKNALFHSLVLQFSNGTIVQLVLQDNLDQRTEIRFNSVANNPTLSDELFQFNPPKGVDVVNDES